MKGWIRDIAIAVLIAVLIMQFVKPTIVKERSMQPNLYENDYVFLSKQAYTLFGDPERGDIVVFHTDMTTEDGQEKLLIKRIIGLPGDVVTVAAGKVYINDELYEEDYTLNGYTTGYVDNLTVPEGSVFVMGDNREVSIDSRSQQVGCVKIEEIMGKAVFRLYPFNKIGTLE